MQWTQEIVSSAPSDVVVENVIELLKRMGFREYERVSSRKDWGIDIVAIRDDPIAGTEKVVIAVHRRGLASSKDVNVFAGLVERYKADKGILVSPVGFTKDAKVLISREYRGRVIPWDGAKLASLFNNYSIEPPFVKGLLYGGGVDQFISQLIGAGALILWAFGCGLVLFKVLDSLMGIRVEPKEELMGLDIIEHGTPAYPEFYTMNSQT